MTEDKGRIVCWQVILKEVLLEPYQIRTVFCRDWKYCVVRKMTESITPVAYWRIKKLKQQ